MAVNGVMRPGFVQLRVMDMDEAIVHYRDRMGLDLVSQEADGRVYLRGYDEFDRHSVILREADTPGLDVMAFKVRNEEQLSGLAKRLKAKGVEVEEIAPGGQPGLGRCIRFTTPTAHVFELYATMELSDKGPETKNPDLWREDPRGMRIIRFDHCALGGVDIEASAKIFCDALDFDVTEQTIDPESGMKVAIFLTCSSKAHDVAFLKTDQDAKIHHASFLLEGWNDVGHAADLMTKYDISVDIGPTRHGITRGQTIYFFDPCGNRNEVFAGGYSFYPDNPVREWSADNVGKAIFYYERKLNDTFLSVWT